MTETQAEEIITLLNKIHAELENMSYEIKTTTNRNSESLDELKSIIRRTLDQ